MKTDRAARRTQAERRAATRQRVLDAATALVAVHGSRALTVAAVGEAAGYSRGIVNHHFGSRARLLEELLQYTQQFDVPTESSDGLGRLIEFVEAYLRGMHERSPRSEAFLKLWAESTGAEPSLQPLFAQRDAWFRELLERHIREGLTDRSIRRETNPTVAAVAIIGLLRGTAMMAFSTARDIAVDELAAEVANGVGRSLAAQPGPAADPESSS
ncbi:TetR/AcrR family transcriptional regulator [Mycolicibacterium sp. 050158]|uniref:TetR/AcrR family transcriptional regulator n=1 Tax=Mycolicibacterium sp. 050158 TaxID=3090602 RepID=UPI00299E28D1|nr:TetR/AcrR family transcriptional regulator [Mycolicibacterium sp. 050158]MDX1892340.1 TetR/AcrR family transcriptional regulator [Mycolicibacterium sp. 050158]